MSNKEIIIDKNLIAACGLYCGVCKFYLQNKYPSCKDNIKAEKGCKIKTCVKNNNFITFADCDKSKNIESLKKMSKF